MVHIVVVSHRFVLILAAIATATLPVRADEPAEPLPPPFEFQPYRVTCAIAADPDEPSAAALAESVARTLPTWLDRMVGWRWQAEVALSPVADWAVRGQLARWPGDGDPATADIVFRVVIRRDGNRAVADVRAFEPLFGHLGPLRTVTCLDDRELPAMVATELLALWRPRAIWERQDDATVRLRVQAAALADGDAGRPVVQIGEVFAPFIVFRNRDRQVQKVQVFPWTNFVLDNLDDGRGTGHVVSGLRSPLGNRPRGRIELIAVAVRPLWPETVVEIVARSKPPQPLPAHRVELSDVEAIANAEAIAVKSALLTDRDGLVRLPRGDEPKLQWLRVTSGDLLLAKVPVLPGATPSARLELPDDHLRLMAEGQLKLLQGDVVSVVAQRAALVASARTAAKRREWTDAKKRLGLLGMLPSAQSLKERVSAIRVPAVTAARQQKDRVTEQRINRLCDDTIELIQHYLTDDKVKQVKEEIAELEAALKVE